MPTTISRWTLRGIAAAILAMAPAAPADILDDIFSLTTQARDRATQARDNAASARDRATEARNNAATAITTAAAARDTAIEIRDTMEDGLATLSGQVRTVIDEAIADLEQEIQEELDGRDAFIADGGCSTGVCQPFRAELIRLLQNLQTLLNTLYDIAGMEDTQVDFGRLISLVEALPGRALYPLYRTLAVETNLFAPGGFIDRLEEANLHLQQINQVLDEDEFTSDGELLDQELTDCAFVLNNLAQIKQAAGALNKFALSAKIVGKGLSAAGETQIHKQGAVWGWAGVTIQNNRTKKIGLIIEGLGSAVGGVTSYASGKMRYCAQVGIEAEARRRDEEILKNQRLILKALQMRAGERP